MGTHNRLLRLGPTWYLELLAIDPQGTTPAHPRWFELDEPAMKARLASGPRLVHWIARVERTELPRLQTLRRLLRRPMRLQQWRRLRW